MVTATEIEPAGQLRSGELRDHCSGKVVENEGIEQGTQQCVGF